LSIIDVFLCVGMAAECQIERSQIMNKAIAMRVLRSRLVLHLCFARNYSEFIYFSAVIILFVAFSRWSVKLHW